MRHWQVDINHRTKQINRAPKIQKIKCNRFAEEESKKSSKKLCPKHEMRVFVSLFTRYAHTNKIEIVTQQID